jgi:dihydroxy-acid dehydratase
MSLKHKFVKTRLAHIQGHLSKSAGFSIDPLKFLCFYVPTALPRFPLDGYQAKTAVRARNLPLSFIPFWHCQSLPYTASLLLLLYLDTVAGKMLLRRHFSSARPLNVVSSRITQPKSQGASQAMLYAVDLTKEDMNKAQVGISSVWFEGNPCNRHLLDLSLLVKEGCKNAGLVGLRFNTVGVSDGISMGTDGMCYSLQSRDLIADSIETTMGGQWYDANISLPGCDKNMPGVVMAMARLNRPSIMIYGGTIRAGCSRISGNKLDVVSAFQSYGEFLSGRINEAERKDIVENAVCGSGACGGMYTANTMASAIEALGMSLPYSASSPADSKEKREECLQAGKYMRILLENDITPRKIMTKEAFENAIRLIMVLGGSTNAVLHLIAMARTAGVSLTIDDFQRLTDITPLLADFKPSGSYVMEDLQGIGGIPAVLKMMLDRGALHGDCMTVTGKTIKENIASLPGLPAGQKIIYPWDSPIKKTGHLQIIRGNLAPGGSVAKITGKEGVYFKGKALCYDSEEEMLAAVERKEVKKGSVIFIRYEGPKGGPGMPEMLTPTSVIMGAGLGKDVALVTDGRFSGGSHGFIIGHVVPEAQEGGPIALVKSGDEIIIDVEKRTIDMIGVSDEEMRKRKAAWKAPPLKVKSGTLYKFVKLCSNASEGCVTDGV